MSGADSTPELDPQERALVEAAWKVREAAVCPHSGFAVGAALESGDGRVWTGANVENASWNLGLCAERVSLFHALTHGGRDFRRMAIVTDTPTPTSPCGACRQILLEFAPGAMIIMVDRTGAVRRRTSTELLPHAFDESSLVR